ncbi:MAG: hypothetical protein ACREDJ_05770 [Methylocella sp.]
MIDRSKTRDTPHSPVTLYEVAHLFGTLVAETVLASVHVRTRSKAGHMDASDLIRALETRCDEGAVHICGMLEMVMDLAIGKLAGFDLYDSRSAIVTAHMT